MNRHPKSDSEIEKDYPLHDNGGYYRELELRNTHRDFGKHNRPNLYYPIYVKSDKTCSLDKTIDSIEVFPTWDDGFKGCWTWSMDLAKENIHLLVGRTVNGKSKIYRKAYAYTDGQKPLKQVKSIWQDKAFFTEKGQVTVNKLFNTKDKYFQSPKSVELIKQLILMSQDKSGIVLDFFSGSATTGQAVMELNKEDGGTRKFILVQVEETIDASQPAKKAGFDTIPDLAKERLKLSGFQTTGDLTSSNDIGFRVLKVSDTNFKDVYYNPNEITQASLFNFESNIKEDRSDLDLFFGCILDWGLPLSLPYSLETIKGFRVHNYNDGDLIACFEENISEELVKEIASRQPMRVVFRDSSFGNSPEKINVFEIFKKYMPEDADDISKRVKVI